MTEMIATRQAYGDTLVELGEKNKAIVVLDADLSKSTTTAKFGKKCQERFFNVGVAEANMMNTAAGLATCGKIAFVSSFSIFATGRAWEQIRNTICYSGLNVKIVATHRWVSVGPDGASHQCIEDISLIKTIPTMTVVEPCDAVETRKSILAAVAHNGPIYIRLGRAADILSKEGIEATVVNMHTIKPLDNEILIKVAKQVNAVVTAEQHVLDGGLGSAVASVLARNYPVPMEMIGMDNRFGQSGEPDILFKEYNLLPEDIVVAAHRAIERKKK